MRNAELSLESRYDQLDNYTITSPISGTVIDKNYNAGENIETGQTLCSIYDLSYLTLTLNVDELDISNIQVGQQVLITAEAVEGRTYTGVVTKVSVAGTSSSGTTTYPVTIRIDETDGLLPGMNVDATITLDSAGGVLAIPSAALNRGEHRSGHRRLPQRRQWHSDGGHRRGRRTVLFRPCGSRRQRRQLH